MKRASWLLAIALSSVAGAALAESPCADGDPVAHPATDEPLRRFLAQDFEGFFETSLREGDQSADSLAGMVSSLRGQVPAMELDSCAILAVHRHSSFVTTQVVLMRSTTQDRSLLMRFAIVTLDGAAFVSHFDMTTDMSNIYEYLR